MNISHSFAEDFKSRCVKAPNGCLAYMGAHTVRLPSEMIADVEFVSPRRAAYLIEYKRHPAREVKLICHTPTCVNPAHFIEGRERRVTNVVIDAKLKQQIRSEAATTSQTKLAAKYGISRRSVANIVTPPDARRV